MAVKTSAGRKAFQKRQERFQKSRKAEIEYAKQLRSVAKQVGVIVKGLAPEGKVLNREALIKALNQYADLITPWARAVASRMLEDLKRRDGTMWAEMGAEIGRNLKDEIEHADTGQVLQDALEAQVHLITSLPREAAQRVHKLTTEALVSSTRASEIAEEIFRTGDVTKSRANLIARTEVARTAAELTKSRATAIGITHYVWRTSGDSDVRESHKKMNGKVVEYAKPPTLSDGTVTHAGEIYNCRCYAEVIVPEDES